MTINGLADAVRNNVVDGLKGLVADFSYSRAQLIAESFLVRSRLLDERATKSKKSLTAFYQTIDSIPIHEIDISNQQTVIRSGICTSYIEFPKIASIFGDISLEYIGMNNKDKEAKSFMIYYDDTHSTHDYNMSRIRKRPYVYVDIDADSNGMIKGYLYNLGKFKDRQYLTVKGIFDDPSILIGNDCCEDIFDDEFPAPNEMQDIILRKMVDYYVTYYRKLNIPDFPNTLTDIKS